MGSVAAGLIGAANRDPRLARVFTTFTATNPSIYLDIDRAKAQTLGLTISDVFTALQATLGGIYVNNFNLYGRTWQVNVQGEASDRGDISDIWRIYVRNSTGQMVPIRSVAGLKIVTGPQVITRYNNNRSVTVNGGPAPGVSSGTALAAMAEISNATLPSGYSFEWTGTAYQEQQASGQTGPSFSRSPCCSPICSWSRCTRVGRSRFPCCCRSWSACSGLTSASSLPD